MVNQSVVNYIREGKRRGFSIQFLKKKLLEAGFREADVDEAISAVEGKQTLTQSAPAEQPRAQVKPSAQPLVQQPMTKSIINNETMKKEESPVLSRSDVKEISPVQSKPLTQTGVVTKTGFKWMKFAAIAGILGAVLALVTLFLSSTVSSIPIVGIVIAILLFICFILYYVGFAKMGRHTNEGLLRTGAWMVLVPMILATLTAVVAQFLVGSQWTALMGGGDTSALKTTLVSLAIVWVLLFLLALLGQLLISIGLIRAGKQVKFAKVAGIFNVIAFVAGLVFIVGLVMLIYSLLNLLAGDFVSTFSTSGITALTGGLAATITFFSISGVAIAKFIGMILEILTFFKASKMYEN